MSKRSEISDKWTILVTAFAGVALSATGIFIYTQGVFVKPLQAEFGWSRGQAALLPAVFGVAVAVAAPLAGLLLDRIGNRLMAVGSIVMLSGSFFALSQMTGNLVVHVLLILAIALSGGGTITAYVRMIAGSFNQARGLALGISMVGSGVAAMFAPALVGSAVDAFGWRTSYLLLGTSALVALPLVLRFAPDAPRAEGTAEHLTGLTRNEAFCTRQFWLMAFSFMLAGTAISGLIPHFVPMLQDSGMSASEAGSAVGIMGVSVIVGRLVTGWLCDRAFAPYLAASVLVLAASGCAGLAAFGPTFAIAGAALIGFGLGAEIDLAAYMSARYFGLRAFGSVVGAQYGAYGLGVGGGAYLYGTLYDSFGGYAVGLWSATGLLLLAMVTILFLGPYGNKASSTSV